MSHTSIHKKFPSWLWGIVLIIGAVVALVLVGWLGLRSQQKSVWADARVECGLGADRLMKELFDKDSYPEEATEIVLFPELPVPGNFDFDPKADWGRMLDWRKEDRFSSGGVPVRILAGLALLRIDPAEEDAMELSNEAVSIAPSFLTPRILEEIRKICDTENLVIDHDQYDQQWEKEQTGRAMIQANQQSGYRVYRNEIYWAGSRSKDDPWQLGPHENRLLVVDNPDDDWAALEAFAKATAYEDYKFQSKRQWLFLNQDEIAQALKNQLEQEGLSKGRWIGAAITVRKAHLGDAGEVLAVREIPGGVLKVGVIDAPGLEAGWREQLRWVVAMIGLAVLAVGAGLWVMMLGVFKERKMAYAKSQFVASVTHELRAPVGSIRLMADALESGKVRSKKVEEFHRLMARESGRLSVLIENVMDLAKVEDGRRAIQIEEIDLAELVAEVCEMMTMQAQDGKVKMVPEGPDLTVKADPVALRQILVNLIDNALKFSPAEGKVTLRWGAGWWLTVADEGPGVPEEIQGRIFERFFRGEDELRRTTKGVGIGLSLVKELVDLHGGTVSVTNEDGAVFKIEIPES